MVRMTAGQRREQLVLVARSVFAEQGYAATSVEDIAEAAGVTRPVVYEHFGGKQGLHTEIVEIEVARLLEAITAPLLDADDPRGATEGSARAFLDYVDQHEEGFLVLARDAPVGSGRGRFASVLTEVADRAESRLAETLDARGYDRLHAAIYARMLVGAVALLGEWWLTERPSSVDEVAAHAVNLLWNGLAHLERQPTIAGTLA